MAAHVVKQLDSISFKTLDQLLPASAEDIGVANIISLGRLHILKG